MHYGSVPSGAWAGPRAAAVRGLGGAAVAVAGALALVALASVGARQRPAMLDFSAVSTIGNDAPTSIATAQPMITGVPFGFDPATGEHPRVQPVGSAAAAAWVINALSLHVRSTIALWTPVLE